MVILLAAWSAPKGPHVGCAALLFLEPIFNKGFSYVTKCIHSDPVAIPPNQLNLPCIDNFEFRNTMRRGNMMLARPVLKRPTQHDDEGPPQSRPVDERYLVKVDGQAKRSFADKAAASSWGGEIKKKFPTVAISIVDIKEGLSERL